MWASLPDPSDIFVFVVYSGFEPDFIDIQAVFQKHGDAVRWCVEQIEKTYGPDSVPERGFLDDAAWTEIVARTDGGGPEEARAGFTIERYMYGRLSASLQARLACSRSSYHTIATNFEDSLRPGGHREGYKGSRCDPSLPPASARRRTNNMESPSGLRRKETISARGPPLRILSLDGGGVRGYSTLLLLDELMHRIVSICDGKPPENKDVVKPCEYFDLIAGVGTGGLIAIMLGRLRMTLKQCRDIYIEMTRVVFESDKTIAGVPWKSTLYKATKLEEAIRACVQDYEHEQNPSVRPNTISPTRPGSMHSYRTTPPRRRSSFGNYGSRYGSYIHTGRGNPDAPLYDTRPNRTRTAVSAVLKGTQGGTPVLLRSYPSQTQRTIESDSTIWQAGRATCATGLAFKPIQIGVSVFHDTGVGYFNPSMQVLDEAVVNEWPGRKVGLFVSVGCGKRPKTDRENSRWDGMAGGFAEAKRRLVAKIDKCEDIHQEMIGGPYYAGSRPEKNEKSYLRKRGVPIDNYVRLNVDTGVGELNMNEYDKLDAITEATMRYLHQEEVRSLIDRGADKMWEIQEIRHGRDPYAQERYEDIAPAYRPPAPEVNAVELPGEDPPSLYPRPLSRPGPQYPAMYPHPLEEVITPQDKFSIIPGDQAPLSVDITPRPSEDGSFRPSSELYGSERPHGENPRVSIDSIPPPLPPKTPIQYVDDPRRHTVPPRNPHPPLPYPDNDGPPPVVNMARKPYFVHR
ncbi:MAG: hypothetical protein Q9172_005349 [Xanthocarpia lactea]